MKKLLILSVVLLLVFGTTGCIKFSKDQQTGSTLGGLFLTEDRFESWKHRSSLMTPGETPGSISEVDVTFIKFDPSDDNAIYVGTQADGLYYSYNNGVGWNKAQNLPAGIVRDLVIDPKDKCTIYAGVSGRIYKSEDCTRTWESVWRTDDSTDFLSSLGLDWYDSKIIWAGLQNGSLLKSEDFGKSWSRVQQFNKRIVKIIVDPHDSRIVYLAFQNGGMLKTIDKGKTWIDLNQGMKDFEDSVQYYDFIVSESKKDLVIYASKFGLLRSLDGGQTWSEIKLLTQKGSEIIYSVAMDIDNSNNIYYATDKALYKSMDGGANWVVKSLPTTRLVDTLLVDPKNSGTLFMGVKKPLEK